jgi:hypothetical protein
MRQPVWTDEETRTLIYNRNLSATALAPLLPNRSQGAIEAGKADVGAYFEGRPVSGLINRRALTILEEEFPLAPGP